ncbi:tripartite tricarboxylate transporter permease [Pseudochelatococcus sp. B33]
MPHDLSTSIMIGVSTAFSFDNLLFCAIGVILGMLVGVMPGIGALATISILIPITYQLDPIPALVMLGGIYYGGSYGGSTASILLNLPGTPSSAVTCLDGYPMAKQGRAGVALLMTTVASFVGASIGIIIMMLFSPLIVGVALAFGPPEYFSLMILGLVAASVVSDGSAVKGLSMVVLGILVGVAGMDIYTGSQRFTFGMIELAEGVSLVAFAMGLFGVAEVIASIKSTKTGAAKKLSLRSMMPTRDDVRRSWVPILRGTGIGSFFGALPGTGATVASFMSYAVEKRAAKDPSRFGKGAVEGVVAPEAANNAADQTAFIPTLALGIPGTATMALMIGVLMIHGITPGPRMVIERPDLFWGLVMSFWIGNFLLLILNIPLIGIWVRVLMIPYQILYPAVLVLICIGVFAIQNSTFDVMVVLVFGVLGYCMRLLDFPVAPLLLGYVLGPLMEEHFRRSMLLSRGSFKIFVAGPISTSIFAFTFALLAWALWDGYRRARQQDGGAE